MELTATTAASLAEVEPIRDEWNRLLEESLYPSIYLRFEYFAAAVRAFSDPDDLFIVLLRGPQVELVGIFPFRLRRLRKGPFRPTAVELAVTDELDKPYPIIKRGREIPAWQRFLKVLTERHPGWDLLHLLEIRDDDPLLLQEPSLFRMPRYRVRRSAYRESPLIALDRDWEQLGDNHKHMRKKLRLMQRDFGVGFRFQVFESTEDWRRCLRDYVALEQRGWKHGMVGIGKSPAMERFYEQVFAAFAPQGFLRFGFLYGGGTLIAGDVAYVKGDHVYFCHGSYDPAYGKYSPGLVSKSLFIRHFHDKGLQWGDYLAGYAGYMQNWSSRIVRTYNLRIERVRVAGLPYLLAGSLSARRRKQSAAVDAAPVRT